MKNHKKDFSNIKNVIFDLDGTLIDSSRSVIKALKIAFAEKLIEPKYKLDKSIIGPPIDKIIETNLVEESTALKNEIRKIFIKIYDEKTCCECRLYPGVYDTLSFLKKNNIKLFIVTNKREFPTLKILEDKNLLTYFEEIYSIDSLKNTCNLKKDIIKKLILKSQLNCDSFIYIGDTMSDYEACLYNKIRFLFASYGYGRKKGEDIQEIESLQEVRLFF